jgi:hypothetical protein
LPDHDPCEAKRRLPSLASPATLGRFVDTGPEAAPAEPAAMRRVVATETIAMIACAEHRGRKHVTL